MALRAFHFNPCIGGFGGESSGAFVGSLWKSSSPRSNHDKSPLPFQEQDGDAFCQMIKELVDNAVDACVMAERNDENNDRRKQDQDTLRVKVEIRPYSNLGNETDNNGESSIKDDILQVTVSDNGCGMMNIQQCVNAFHSTKCQHSGAKNNTETVHPSCKKDGNNIIKRKNDIKAYRHHTAGRYGIGLTLCLVHGQRLVPSSYACITSATKEAPNFTRAFFVVDTQKDTVICHKQEQLPKSNPRESGTCVSLLVPGGRMAQLAWPRISNYMARFQLVVSNRQCTSLMDDIRTNSVTATLPCSLEVLAPTLSKAPLFIRAHRDYDQQYIEKRESWEVNQHRSDSCEEEEKWVDDLDDNNCAQDRHGRVSRDKQGCQNSSCEGDNKGSAFPRCGRKRATMRSEAKRHQILQSAKLYLQRQSLHLENVAHSVQPIRLASFDSKRKDTTRTTVGADVAMAATASSASTLHPQQPQLQVDMVVCGTPNNDQDHDFSSYTRDTVYADGDVSHDHNSGEDAATIRLIRFVNRIPVLDGAEAAACGLVQALPQKSIWGSFGLHVTAAPSSCTTNQLENDKLDASSLGSAWEASFHIRDSDQVAPFFQSQTHAMWEGAIGSEEEYNDNEANNSCHGLPKGSSSKGRNKKRERVQRGGPRGSISSNRKWLLPAKVRLGEVLVIVQINAEPSSLPLPTLSKGRLPLNHKPIQQAFHVGLRECLRSLERTNPGLFLTPKLLHKVERDARYIPSIASAISRVVCAMEHSSEEGNDGSYNKERQSRLLGCINTWQAEFILSPRQPKLVARVLEERIKAAIVEAEEVAKQQKAAIIDERRFRTNQSPKRTKKKQKGHRENESVYDDIDGSDMEDDCAGKTQAGTAITTENKIYSISGGPKLLRDLAVETSWEDLTLSTCCESIDESEETLRLRGKKARESPSVPSCQSNDDFEEELVERKLALDQFEKEKTEQHEPSNMDDDEWL